MSPRKKMKIVEAKPMMLLPPAPDKCQTCAVAHHPDYPHDASSLFYLVKFKMDHGREGTWNDAMAHCNAQMRAHWRRELKKRGIDPKSNRTRGN